MALYPYEIKTGERLEAALRSSLIKIFPDELPEETDPLALHSVLPGQNFSFQLALKSHVPITTPYKVNTQIEAKSPLPFETPAIDLNIREVVQVPVMNPANQIDEHFLKDTAGLYPDLLKPLENEAIKLAARQWQSLWFELSVPKDIRPGSYIISIWLVAQGTPVDETGFRTEGDDCRLSFTFDVLPVKVEAPVIKHTEWFHADCLADFYNVEVFSDEHWTIMRNFMKAMVKRHMNMILTPIFTPPLDTVIGGERTTVQLIGVRRFNDGGYEFDFSLLGKWIDVAKEEGIEYFELAHLFTQWGAKAAPKVMAETEDGYKRIFGWDTPASESAYGHFLSILLPQLVRYLDEKGLQDKAVFHVSDEPYENFLDDYIHAKSLVEPYVGDYKIMDALSNVKFYKSGAVNNPVASSNHLEDFLEAKVPGLWTYYCVSQWDQVSNRFMAMPSARTRILGWQLYTERIEGFLHWGFNFYNSQFSLSKINPFIDTGSGKMFPAGDAFIVYPGDEGEPWESLRMVLMGDTMEDLAALQALDLKFGEGTGDQFLLEELGSRMTMKVYPRDSHTLLELRQKLNERLAKD